jgi:hypothetical protein
MLIKGNQNKVIEKDLSSLSAGDVFRHYNVIYMVAVVPGEEEYTIKTVYINLMEGRSVQLESYSVKVQYLPHAYIDPGDD